MARVSAVALTVIFLASSALTVTALSPVDDDAGTGHDAGDHELVATQLIVPGTVNGSVTAPHDRQDVYALHLDAGDVLHVGTDVAVYPDAAVHMELVGPTDDPSPFASRDRGTIYHWFDTHRIIETAGTWYVRITLPNDPEIVATPQDYSFTWSVTQPAIITMWELRDARALIELGFQDPADWTIQYQTAWGRGEETFEGRGFARTNLSSTDGERTYRYSSSFAASSIIGFTERISVAGQSHELPPLLPSDDAEDLFVRTQALHVEDMTGWFRAGMAATTVSHLRVVVAGPSMPLVAHQTADDVIVVTGDDIGTDQDTVTPAVAQRAGTTFEIDIPADLRGVIRGHGATVKATAPDGTDHTSEHGIYLYRPEAGSWTFQIDAHGSVANTDAVYFFGANYPPLGIAPEDTHSWVL